MAETKSRSRSSSGGKKAQDLPGLFGFSEEELKTILAEMLLYRRFEEKDTWQGKHYKGNTPGN